MKRATVLLSDLLDHAEQSRVRLDPALVQHYHDRMTAGDRFPPPSAIKHNGTWILWDGLHRVQALVMAGEETVAIEYQDGTEQDAKWLAAAANSTHGQPRNNADKRRAVQLALQARPESSDRDIAKHCLVSHPFVADVRKGVPPAAREPVEEKLAEPKDTVGLAIPEHLATVWQSRSKLSTIGAIIRGIISRIEHERAAENPLFLLTGVIQSLGMLSNAESQITGCIPAALCPECGGQLLESCGVCRGVGFISRAAIERNK